MNTKTRFLVLDSSNQPVRPRDYGLTLGDAVQNDKSPSFLDEASAIKFCQLVAGRNKGSNFYVVKTIGAASAKDDLDAHLEEGETRTAPVTFIATT